MVFDANHPEFPDQPKGLAAVLTERGVDVAKKTKDQMQEMLAQHDDFLLQQNIIEELVTSHGHICIFLPKFSPELSPIELVWSLVKRTLRENCDFNGATLRQRVKEAMDAVKPESIKAFHRRSLRYLRGYEANKTGFEIDEWVEEEKQQELEILRIDNRVQKSHRRIMRPEDEDLKALEEMQNP